MVGDLMMSLVCENLGKCSSIKGGCRVPISSCVLINYSEQTIWEGATGNSIGAH